VSRPTDPAHIVRKAAALLGRHFDRDLALGDPEVIKTETRSTLILVPVPQKRTKPQKIAES
jgi:hypothetical protein